MIFSLSSSRCSLHSRPTRRLLVLKPQDLIRSAADPARDWLLNSAAPLWSTSGRLDNGLYAERILLSGAPDNAPYRVFVQARHIYSFAEIGRLGWDGPWAAQLDETINLLLTKARRADGFFVNSLTSGGDVHDSRADLYVQAFVLFALGRAGEALGRNDLFDEAERLTRNLDEFWRHPNGGYAEGQIDDNSIRRQNPHMHLLEAHLSLHAASGRTCFAEAAERIAILCRDHFIDRETGALLEYFQEDWTPAADVSGKIVEPGHCFEWAWLFERIARNGWSDGIHIAEGLTTFARRTGIDIARGVAINEVLLDGARHNENARLWPQTERLKAAVARYQRTHEENEAREIADAAKGLAKYLAVDIPGLWRDKLTRDGSWIDEPSPGSSLYHITCGYAELLQSY